MAKELWEVMKEMSSMGRPRAFGSPEEMMHRACEYFQWCSEQVMLEEKISFFQGDPSSAFVAHKRPMTQAGLCVFLGIGYSTWHDYKQKDEFSEVVKTIESIMFEQKFTGASVGLFNANIISRELGLTDKQEVKMDNGSVTAWSEIGDSDE